MYIFKKKIIFLCLLSVLFFSCSKKNNASSFITITDHSDEKVLLPKKIESIVVCDVFPLPSVLCVFFDSASKIKGIAPSSMSAAKNSLLAELYPEILNAKTDFIKGNDINIEELIKINPDVVFYSATNGRQKEVLQKAGFNAVGISANKWDYDCIKTLSEWINLLSEIFPKNDKSKKIESYSNEIYNLVQNRISLQEKQKSFFLFQCSSTNILTSGKNFFGSWWANSSGSINVSDELKGFNASKVNLEQIYEWNPDVIFITNFTKIVPEDLYNNNIGNYDWSLINAVKNKRVYKMPLGMYRSYTPGVDTPITLLWFSKTTYPSLFEDIDLNDWAINYYKDVFNVSLTKEQAERIFNPLKEAGNVFIQK